MSQNKDIDETLKKVTDEYKVDWDVWVKYLAPYKRLNWDKVSKNRNVEMLGQTFEDIEFTNEVKNLMESIHFTSLKVKELKDLVSILEKSRKQYIADLKIEVIAGKTGVILHED